MKIKENKQYIFSALFILLCLLFFAVFLYIGTKVIPNSITYTASTSENSKVSEENMYAETELCEYESIYSIAEDGPFRISTAKDSIYIFSEDKCLYRIKASLDRFPASDRNVILEGIDISDKAMLYEIVEYMES